MCRSPGITIFCPRCRCWRVTCLQHVLCRRAFAVKAPKAVLQRAGTLLKKESCVLKLPTSCPHHLSPPLPPLVHPMPPPRPRIPCPQSSLPPPPSGTSSPLVQPASRKFLEPLLSLSLPPLRPPLLPKPPPLTHWSCSNPPPPLLLSPRGAEYSGLSGANVGVGGTVSPSRIIAK